ncbi:ABC transporter permease [Microvirga arabica]|uniref:ABC transporter permease n=1 Tax=Microvirga arabica TaxID=1128671 RepID=UPI001939B56E|nr:ABC transporter permease [Microvirga arabica]MBM1169947.1 ABC transporter permease [Microvirga arabica]
MIVASSPSLPEPVGTRFEPSSRTQARLVQLARALHRAARNPSTLAGSLIVLALVFAAILAPLLATHDPMAQDLAARLTPPGAAHWLGTDQLGRDLYSRLLYGAQPTLMIVVLVVALSAPFGVAIGLLAGYFGGWVEAVLMRVTDIVMAFPRLILALALVAVLQPGLVNAVIAIAITAWPPYARLARAETLSLRHSEFVEAARGLGMPSGQIITGQILPLCLSSAAIRATLDMAGIILTAAGLGFLGLGAQPPMAEWGAMIAAGRDHIFDAWWVAAVPGLAIVLVSLGFNLLGDGLRDVLDPKHHD